MVTVLVLNALVAQALGPYALGQTGYDVSYPQCPGTSAPPGSYEFGIIGVNHGRPFTVNGCLASEYQTAAHLSTPSLYINAAYAGAYRKDITPPCAAGLNQAWRIGCSEADYAAQRAAGLTPAMWWIDVETGNSWSTSNLTLNQQAIQGAIDHLKALTPSVGVYSTGSMWKAITGGSFVPSGVAGDFLPAASCSSASPFMPGTTVWLTQVTSNAVDVDTAC